jgi:PucR family transcriptional regulator, purine catabolism regulatory protein
MTDELPVLPTLRELCRSLGHDLAPVAPAEVPAVRVTAVHVSELDDPAVFLDGGELLLTIGLGFQPSALWFGAYVQRLVSRGVAGLAVGLGPVHSEMPPALVEAASRAGLPLLVVPPQTPFLTISRCYWSMSAQAGQRELTEMLSAHRALVAAALSSPREGGPAPVPAVLRRLAIAIGGWAAYLSAGGQLRSVWPHEKRGAARDLQAAVRRLRAAGAPTSLSLPLGDDDVVVQPVGDKSRLLGYLAVGRARPLPRQGQQLAMTAAALLTLEAVHAERLRLAARGSEAVVLDLLQAGETAAARKAAAFLGADLPGRARAALLAGTDPGTLLAALGAQPGSADHVLLAGQSGATCSLLLRDTEGCAGWVAQLVASVPGARGALAAAADLDRVGEALRRAAAALADAALADAGPGSLIDLGRRDAAGPLDNTAPHSAALRGWAERRLAPLTAGDHDDILATVAAVLRARSELDASRELGVHRHTVRNRVARAEALLAVTLDEPDTRAELWLALRLTGRALGTLVRHVE